MKWVTIGTLMAALAGGIIIIAQGPALLVKRHTYQSKAAFRKERDAELAKQREHIDALFRLTSYVYGIAFIPIMVAWFLVEPLLLRIELMVSIAGLAALIVGIVTMLRGIR